ncbi:hypothetical protein AB3S75_023087 [Citrus x aurantiifolia]
MVVLLVGEQASRHGCVWFISEVEKNSKACAWKVKYTSIISEDDDGDEDDQVEANDSEFEEVVLEDD